MTNENTIKSMVAARCEEIGGNSVEAHHVSGEWLTEAAQKRLDCPDPADAWNCEAIEIAWDQQKILAELKYESFDDLEELSEAIDRVMCSVAETHFHAWAQKQTWWGVCPVKSIDDVCMSFDCGPAWDLESFE